MEPITVKLTGDQQLTKRCALILKDGDVIEAAIGPSSKTGGPIVVFKPANSAVASVGLLRDLNRAEGLLSPRVFSAPLGAMKRRLATLLVGNVEATSKPQRHLKMNDNPPLELNPARVIPAGHLVGGVAAFVCSTPLIQKLKNCVTPDPMLIITHDKGLKSEPLKGSKIAAAIRQTGDDWLRISIQKEPVTPAQKKYGLLALAHARKSRVDNSVPAALQESVLSSWADGNHVWRMNLKMSRGLVSAFKLDVSQLMFQPAQEVTEWERQLDPDEEDLRPYPYLYTLNEVLAVLNTVFLPPAGAN